MNAPATVEYPLRDIKLLLVPDDEQKCTHWLLPAIWKGRVKLTDLVRKIRPGCKIPDDPVYWKVYRRIKRLEQLGYVKTEKQSTILTEETFALQQKEQDDRVKTIFDAVINKDTPPIVSSGALSTEAQTSISTVKKEDPAFYVVPTPHLFTLLCRVQNSNRFFESAKVRGEWGQLRADLGMSLAQLKTQRRKCPYYLSTRTRGTRIDAVFKLRSMRKHSYFRRRDKRVVNEEVVRELSFVQSKFDQYIDDVDGLKCALVHKEDGSIKFIDYQTRFTDPDRKKATIGKYHDTWKKAAESYNSGVFLTLTSFPPSEATKHQHRASLWHVNRHFAVAWNAYMSLLQKRKRAARRDELLDVMREQVQKVRTVKVKELICDECSGTGILYDKTGSVISPCKKCDGFGILPEVQLTKKERDQALAPMKEENFRAKYLQVYEFQKNGMIHGHCVIFGSQWLDKFEQIKSDWVRLGQGERIHVYALHREGKIWKWSKAAPADSRNKQPVDYLGKYLVKGVHESKSHGMYWAINKRFFTNSRALQEEWIAADPEMEKLPATYEYLGTFKGDDIPPWLRINDRNRQIRQRSGALDALGWGTSPGPGVPA